MDVPPPLSAADKNSFAYPTIKERLPVILAKIADTLYRTRDKIKSQYQEDVSEELKSIIGSCSKLRNEVQTNKVAVPLQDSRNDTQVWNRYLQAATEREGSPPSWFKSAWLYMECYMYRRIQESVEKCNMMKEFDVFGEQKEKSFTDSVYPTEIVMMHLLETQQKIKENEELIPEAFKLFLKVCLWGNKCDLSISGGEDNAQTSSPLEQLDKLEPNILINDSDEVLNHLRSRKCERIDIVLDNAGFELISDLCFAEFLLSAGLCSTIYLHAKAFPWFVSDVTKKDFDWTLQMLGQINHIAVSSFAQLWKERLNNNTWILQVDDFWTLPYDYSQMETYAPDLYQSLQKSDMIFFKGDLNYRKLLGDLKWPFTSSFETCLRGFYPAPLCVLRTSKSDVLVGLPEGRDEEVMAQDKDWLVNGNWGVINACLKTK
ncbi:damage-control phosphatase ARMT1-like [Mytilus edulis]|uniref:damage-control phosphatase ARMT1-like n=1 Tax=Mytilus edulis TaxID=6550 RepID=UPI0039EFC434